MPPDNNLDPFGLRKAAEAARHGPNHIKFLFIFVGIGIVTSFLVLASLAPQIGDRLGTLSVKKQTQESQASSKKKVTGNRGTAVVVPNPVPDESWFNVNASGLRSGREVLASFSGTEVYELCGASFGLGCRSEKVIVGPDGTVTIPAYNYKSFYPTKLKSLYVIIHDFETNQAVSDWATFGAY